MSWRRRWGRERPQISAGHSLLHGKTARGVLPAFLDAHIFVSWSLTPMSPQPVGNERGDECQNLWP